VRKIGLLEESPGLLRCRPIPSLSDGILLRSIRGRDVRSDTLGTEKFFEFRRVKFASAVGGYVFDGSRMKSGDFIIKLHKEREGF
jgi:hypothetical protein